MQREKSMSYKKGQATVLTVHLGFIITDKTPAIHSGPQFRNRHVGRKWHSVGGGRISRRARRNRGDQKESPLIPRI